jgi:hypothetical protein
MKWRGLVIFWNGLVLVFRLFIQLFSFKLFGIFVNIRNKNPPLHKAGGTLAASRALKKNSKNHES